MEFDFGVGSFLPDEITVLTKDSFPVLRRSVPLRLSAGKQRTDGPALAAEEDKERQMVAVVDALGRASAKAQSLPAIITTADKLRMSDHRLYVLRDPAAKGTVQGIIKVGTKNLFVVDNRDAMTEIKPTCVLDFYVHESCQRSGLGKRLFEFFLERENLAPRNLAYDRPSPKFVAFLAKHYNLKSHKQQPNNYLVFREFFEKSVLAEKQVDRHGVVFSGKKERKGTQHPAPTTLPAHPQPQPLPERNLQKDQRRSGDSAPEQTRGSSREQSLLPAIVDEGPKEPKAGSEATGKQEFHHTLPRLAKNPKYDEFREGRGSFKAPEEQQQQHHQQQQQQQQQQQRHRGVELQQHRAGGFLPPLDLSKVKKNGQDRADEPPAVGKRGPPEQPRPHAPTMTHLGMSAMGLNHFRGNMGRPDPQALLGEQNTAQERIQRRLLARKF